MVVRTAFFLAMSCTMMPSSSSPLADFTTPWGPPVKRAGSAFAIVIANENVHPRIATSRTAARVFVSRHPGAAVADAVLYVVVVDRQSGQQRAALVEPGELRGVLGEFVVTETALVIEDFTPAFRPALGGFAKLVS